MNDTDEIYAWRRETRKRLSAQRRALPIEERRQATRRIAQNIRARFNVLARICTAWYWPIQGEPDLRYLARYYRALGAVAALPVVVHRDSPVEFWLWHPKVGLTTGFGNIPIPAERVPLRPSALIVPLLGFDEAGYRLGYGSGYYDRTLSAVRPLPLTIGVGYESSRLDTIHPLPHDVPMDAIVTEKEVRWLRYRGRPRQLRRSAPYSRAGSNVDRLFDSYTPPTVRRVSKPGMD